MPIETKCPGCSRQLRVGDDHAGKKARCPVCNTIYVVPSPGQGEVSATSEPNDASWYMKTPEGQVFGPVARQETEQWLNEGRISAECFLRSEETAPWRPAGEYFAVLGTPQAGKTASSPFSETSQGMNRVFGGYARSTFQAPHRGGLLLTLGILAWVFGCPIFAVMAWMMGTSDLREMRAGRMNTNGMGLTQAGQILGMINCLLWLAITVISMFGLILAIMAGAIR